MSVLIVLSVGKSFPMTMKQKLALGMKKVIFVFTYIGKNVKLIQKSAQIPISFQCKIYSF